MLELINNIRYINFTYDKSYDTIISDDVQERIFTGSGT